MPCHACETSPSYQWDHAVNAVHVIKTAVSPKEQQNYQHSSSYYKTMLQKHCFVIRSAMLSEQFFVNLLPTTLCMWWQKKWALMPSICTYASIAV